MPPAKRSFRPADMATIYQLKPAFQRVLRPIVGWLAVHGATANQVTIAAMLMSAAAGAVVAA